VAHWQAAAHMQRENATRDHVSDHSIFAEKVQRANNVNSLAS
jgi:hypothetical protein